MSTNQIIRRLKEKEIDLTKAVGLWYNFTMIEEEMKMGYFGPGPFDNDTALDFVGSYQSSRNKIRLLSETLIGKVSSVSDIAKFRAALVLLVVNHNVDETSFLIKVAMERLEEASIISKAKELKKDHKILTDFRLEKTLSNKKADWIRPMGFEWSDNQLIRAARSR